MCFYMKLKYGAQMHLQPSQAEGTASPRKPYALIPRQCCEMMMRGYLFFTFPRQCDSPGDADSVGFLGKTLFLPTALA